MQFKRFSRINFFSGKKKRVGNIDDTHVLTVLSGYWQLQRCVGFQNGMLGCKAKT